MPSMTPWLSSPMVKTLGDRARASKSIVLPARGVETMITGRSIRTTAFFHTEVGTWYRGGIPK
jgi:hypothetical protein